MKEQLYRITCVCFDLSQRQTIIDRSLVWLKEHETFPMSSIKKRWENGFHNEYILTGTLGQVKRFAGLLESLLKELEDSSKDVDLEKMAKQLKQLSLVENSKADTQTLRKDRTVAIEQLSEESSLSTVYDSLSYQKVQQLKTNWIKKYCSGFHQFNENDKEDLFLQMLLLAAERFHFSERYQGMKYGSISYFSHFQGYFSQLEAFPEAYKEMYKNKITTGIATIQQKKDMLLHWIDEWGTGKAAEETTELLVDWEILVDKLYTLHYHLAENKHLFQETSYEIASFLDKKEQVSEFHQNFTMNASFSSFASSTEFKAYRGMINQVYEILTFFSVNSLQRTIYCGAISTLLFESFDLDIEELMKEIAS